MNAEEKRTRAPAEDSAGRTRGAVRLAAEEGRDDGGRWVPVYVAVVIVTVLVITSLWLFSRAFSS